MTTTIPTTKRVFLEWGGLVCLSPTIYRGFITSQQIYVHRDKGRGDSTSGCRVNTRSQSEHAVAIRYNASGESCRFFLRMSAL